MAATGAIVHITGTGFNAIEGYTTAPLATDCATLKQGNTCNPVKGTCVEFLDPATQQWTPATDILAITPTHLVVTSPIACSAPTKVRVRRRVASIRPSPPAAISA